MVKPAYKLVLDSHYNTQWKMLCEIADLITFLSVVRTVQGHTRRLPRELSQAITFSVRSKK